MFGIKSNKYTNIHILHKFIHLIGIFVEYLPRYKYIASKHRQYCSNNTPGAIYNKIRNRMKHVGYMT